MKKIARKLALAFALTTAFGVGALATSRAAAAKPAFSACPRDIQCIDLYAPVLCSDGKVYGNSCYAYRACATGCVPIGGTV
jgi:hypothetical protein